jgi:hypothetical protein
MQACATFDIDTWLAEREKEQPGITALLYKDLYDLKTKTELNAWNNDRYVRVELSRNPILAEPSKNDTEIKECPKCRACEVCKETCDMCKGVGHIEYTGYYDAYTLGPKRAHITIRVPVFVARFVGMLLPTVATRVPFKWAAR